MRHAAVLAAAVSPSLARADEEVVAFGVEDFELRCCRGGLCDDLHYTVDSAIKFRDIMYADAGYAVRYAWTNLGVDDYDWLDNHYWISGSDDVSPGGTDWADVVYYSGHGGNSCDETTSWIVMGDDANGTAYCRPKLASYGVPEVLGPDIRLADGGVNEDANYLILDASTTLQWCVVESFDLMAVDRGGASTQFTLINGFHGSPRDQVGDPDDTGQYVIAAKYNELGSDWVDRMTTIRAGSDNDDCAASYVLADSSAIASTMYDYGGFMDWKDNGVHDEQWYWVVCNCDPPAGPNTNTLPGC